MPPTNDFVPFCNENTGTNLPTQSAYIANPNLPIGNQPGIASSSFNNKPLRQATTIAAILAQFTVAQTGADMLDNQNTADHANPAALLGALTAALKFHSPVTTRYLSSSGQHNLTYKFQTASANATVGATYSDGTTTYTVQTTIAAGTQLNASGGAVPVAIAGTLTKTGGTGDATITYYAYRMPSYLKVRLIAGGGGGGGAGTGAGSGGAGTGSTFGALAVNGGLGGGTSGSSGGTGGTATLGVGVGLNFTGAAGNYGTTSNLNIAAGFGGVSPFGGAGSGAAPGGNGGDAVTNTGSGGAGAPGNAASYGAAGGGGAGGYIDAVITSPVSQYSWNVGTAGAQGAAGTGGHGGLGASGVVIVEEHYQ